MITIAGMTPNKEETMSSVTKGTRLKHRGTTGITRTDTTGETMITIAGMTPNKEEIMIGGMTIVGMTTIGEMIMMTDVTTTMTDVIIMMTDVKTTMTDETLTIMIAKMTPQYRDAPAHLAVMRVGGKLPLLLCRKSYER